MSDEPRAGWLPPQAPGGRAAPRFERPTDLGGWDPPVPPRPAPPAWSPEPPRQAAAPASPAPTFVKSAEATAKARNPLALTSIALGIGALALLALSLGLSFVVSLPLSVAGWACAAQARKRARAGRAPAAEGQLRAGIWLGAGGAALALVALVVWGILIANGFDLEAFRDELQRDLDSQRNSDPVEAAPADASLW